MTTNSKARSEPDAPVTLPARYADDLYGFVEQQVTLLSASRLSEIDAGNIAEELSDAGGEQYDKFQTALRVPLLQPLMWDHQPPHCSQNWLYSICEPRQWIVRVLHPSLKFRTGEAVAEGYDDARDDAMGETGLADAPFPLECPYDWSAIMTRVVEFGDLRSLE